jgi:phosphoglycerate dehydrogenase-like enzyme
MQAPSIINSTYSLPDLRITQICANQFVLIRVIRRQKENLMSSLILVHPTFEATWPFVADHLHALWQRQGDAQLVRVQPDETRAVHELGIDLARVERLVALCVPATAESVQHMPALKEAAILREYGPLQDDALAGALQARHVKTYQQRSEGFWGESVSEFGLALTLCALRRIPQTHAAMIHALDGWDYSPAGGVGNPGGRGYQFGDDTRFTNGTVEGKRVRIVGAGNIASRYASFMRTLGADVAAWDPFASEPAFHRAGSRREYHLDRLGRDAEIFVPMVPLTDSTRGLVTREHILALPKGCLVVLVTRALICDTAAIRERVLNDEIALAADVFDVEPLPLDDPLLGRHNVVHTPHNAGRTKEANFRWAEMLVDQFLPR